jgi:hypothetical protein
MGGISYNVWLRGLCAGVSWFRTEEEEEEKYCRFYYVGYKGDIARI